MTEPFIPQGFIDTSGWDEMYPERGTLQLQSEGARNARGVPTTEWADVPGLVDLPLQLEMKGGDEFQGTDGSTVVSTHVAMFQTYHPAITEKMQLVVEGQIYNILLAGSDPMKVNSILKVKKVTG
jgi:SPP1 family predicted phage head-tail adaptor